MPTPPTRRRAAPRPPLALACLALAALACAGPAPTPTAPQLSRVVLAPLNLGVRTPDPLVGCEGPVWDELVRYLQAQDAHVRVLDGEGAAELWQQAVSEAEASGAVLDPRGVGARFAVHVREQVDYDVLVMPSLVLRSARIGGQRASWDGTRRKLPIRARVPADLADGIGDGGGYRGTVAAASLYVALVGPDGRALFEGLAGLDLVQQLVRGRRGLGPTPWQLEARADPFDDPEALRSGVERAFARPLPATARTW